MPTEAFIARAGIVADAALRARIAAFLKAHGISRSVLRTLTDEQVAAYARCLASGWPVSYARLLTETAMPFPGNADVSAVRQIAALAPDGASTRALLADFDINRLYFDEDWPVVEDVCRAGLAVDMTPARRTALRVALAHAPLSDWPAAWVGRPVGDADRPLVLALGLETGTARFTALGTGSGAPARFMDTLSALFEAVGEVGIRK